MADDGSTDEAGRRRSSGAPPEETHQEKQARRVRENQRRSRRKRKEHIEELQNKLRQCHKQGVEASAEIQAAAHKVIDENDKLRRLLTLQGVSDEFINEYLVSGHLVSPRHHSVTGYMQQRPDLVSPTVKELKQSMAPRRPRCLEPGEPFCASSSPNLGYPTSSNSAISVKNETSMMTAPPRWEVDNRNDEGLTHSAAFLQSRYQHPQVTRHIISPRSATFLSRTDAAMTLTGLGKVDAGPEIPAPPCVPGGPLPTPPYSYNMQSFACASAYPRQESTGQELLLQSPAGPSAMSSNYLEAARTGGNTYPIPTDILSGMTGIDHHNASGQVTSMPDDKSSTGVRFH